jgi:hypothetical protein
VVVVVIIRETAMNDVTYILSKIEHGDPTAAEQLLPLVYDELRRAHVGSCDASLRLIGLAGTTNLVVQERDIAQVAGERESAWPRSWLRPRACDAIIETI